VENDVSAVIIDVAEASENPPSSTDFSGSSASAGAGWRGTWTSGGTRSGPRWNTTPPGTRLRPDYDEAGWLSEHVGVLPEDRVRIDPDLWARLAGFIECREACRAVYRASAGRRFVSSTREGLNISFEIPPRRDYICSEIGQADAKTPK